MKASYKPRYGQESFRLLETLVHKGPQPANRTNPKYHCLLYKLGLADRKQLRFFPDELWKESQLYHHPNMNVYFITPLGEKMYNEVLQEHLEKQKFNF